MKGDARKDFTSNKSSLHYEIHLNLHFFFREKRKGKALSPAHERKQDRATMLLLSCCTSLILMGILILMMAWHVPLCQHVPKELFVLNPKRTIGGIQVHVILLTDCRTPYKYATWLSPSTVFTIMSSTYNIYSTLSCRKVKRPLLIDKWRQHSWGWRAWHCSSSFHDSTWRFSRDSRGSMRMWLYLE